LPALPGTGIVTTTLVAGASGGTGRAILDRLSSRETTVRALTRSAENHRTLLDGGADEVVVGDLLNPADAAEAVADADAVLCTVGTPVGLGALGGQLVDGEGTVNLLEASEAAGVERFVLESSLGVGDSKAGIPLPFRVFLDLFGILSAKGRAESRLRDSPLTHTIFRPGGLTDRAATGDVLVAEGGDTVSGSIPRADMARLMVAALETPEGENRTFEVVAADGVRGTPTGLVDIDWQSG
jgi:uncharacterized protein YbjT (DUF2867 family)